MHCANCGMAIELTSISRRDDCPRCREDLHSCRNCDFYDPAAYGRCRETSAEPETEPARANFCDWFRPAADRQKPDAKATTQQDLEALFKK